MEKPQEAELAWQAKASSLLPWKLRALGLMAPGSFLPQFIRTGVDPFRRCSALLILRIALDDVSTSPR